MMASSLPAAAQKPDATLSLGLPNLQIPTNALIPRERDLKLVQLLLTCAKHAASGNLHHADACLRQVSQLASTDGDSMQRLAVHSASALAARLVKRWPGLYKALINGSSPAVSGEADRGRSIFARLFPCMGFAYAVVNKILIKAVYGERVIHVVGLGCGNPTMWAPFIRGFKDVGPEGQPRLIKITCVSTNKNDQETLEASLVKEAEGLKIPFQFNPLHVSLRELTVEMIKPEPDEVVAFVSILSLHVLLAEDDRVDARFGLGRSSKEVKDCKSMSKFLEMVKSMSPKVLLLVEQESDYSSSRLVDRFVEVLHYYSAMFESIDVAFKGLSCPDRTTLEDMFGKEIENIVSNEGMERELRHERFANWSSRLGKSGFRPAKLWYESMEEARKVVEGYGLGGFKVIGEKGSLMICWHDRPIYTVSAWNCFRFLAQEE